MFQKYNLDLYILHCFISFDVIMHFCDVLEGISSKLFIIHRDLSRDVSNQWETLLKCINVSLWLGAYLDWSLYIELPKKYAHILYLIVLDSV